MKKLSLAVLGALLLAACGGGHEQYEGYWNRQTLFSQPTAEISSSIITAI